MLNLTVEVENQTSTVSLVTTLAGYAATAAIHSDSAIGMARHCLIDALGGGFDALRDPACAPLIGPLVPGALMPGGARVPGTSLELDPSQAAFCTTLMLCRSPSRDQWMFVRDESVHGSLGAILTAADYQGRKAVMEGKSPPKVRDVLAALVKSVEIQGVLITEGGEGQWGTGGAIRLARAAATALVAAQLGGTFGQIVTALSYASLDGGMTLDEDERYGVRRRDLAMADAISRAVRHACQATVSPSSYLTSLDLAAVNLAGELLGAKPWDAGKSFATRYIDRVAAVGWPQDVAPLTARFQAAADRYFPARQAERVKALFAVPERLDDLPVNELLAALVINGAR